MSVLAFEAPKKAIRSDSTGIIHVHRSYLNYTLSEYYLNVSPHMPKYCTLNGEPVRLVALDHASYAFKRFETVIDGVAAMED